MLPIYIIFGTYPNYHRDHHPRWESWWVHHFLWSESQEVETQEEKMMKQLLLVRVLLAWQAATLSPRGIISTSSPIEIWEHHRFPEFNYSFESVICLWVVENETKSNRGKRSEGVISTSSPIKIWEHHRLLEVDYSFESVICIRLKMKLKATKWRNYINFFTHWNLGTWGI